MPNILGIKMKDGVAINKVGRILSDEELRKVIATAKYLSDEKKLIETSIQLHAQPAIQALLKDANTVLPGITDATPAQLMQRALEYVSSQMLYTTKQYTIWRTAFPIDMDMREGANTKIYKVLTHEGIAEYYQSGGNMPNVAIGMKEISIKYNDIWLGYALEYLEMIASDYAGLNVEVEKVAAVGEGLDDRVEELVFIGDSVADRPGVINHPNITAGNLPTGEWDDPAQTAANIIADIQYGIDQIVLACEADKRFQDLKVDIMCAPRHERILKSRVGNTYNDMTIEDVVRTRDAKFGKVIASPQHSTTAGGSGDLVTFIPTNDADTAVISMSTDKKRMPIKNNGWSIEQPFHTKFGRFHLKRPLRAWQGDGANNVA